jgi:hypothetical protein
MRIAIGEGGHNRVTWEARSPLLRVLLGLLIATVFLAALVIPSPSPVRWRVVGLLVGFALVLATILTVTTPLVDGGYLERLPDGGQLERFRAWPLINPRMVLQLPLDEVSTFEVEAADFEDFAPEMTRLARLWVRDTSGRRALLTDWAEPSSVTELGESLAKTGRRELTR